MRNSDSANSVRPSLEEATPALEELNKLRTRAIQMRDDGWKSLRQAIEKGSNDDVWADDNNEPSDFVSRALLLMIAKRDFVRISGNFDDDLIENLIKRFEDYRTDHFVAGPTNRVPIFQAARVFQALIASGTQVFSRPAMLAYYRIFRELFTVQDGSWVVGSARATEETEINAFMTSECTRAINAFARSLECTADTLDTVVRAFLSLKAVSDLEKAPDIWKDADSKRILLSLFVTLSQLKRRSVIALNKIDLDLLLETGGHGPKAMEAFLKTFAQRVLEGAESALSGTSQAMTQIDEYNRKELDDMRAQRGRTGLVKRRIELSQITALGAVGFAKAQAEKAKKLFETWGGGLPPDLAALEEWLKGLNNFAGGLRKEAKILRDLLLSTRKYLESVLNQEVQGASTGHINAGELAFAASAYRALTGSVSDRRLEKAVELLSAALSVDGTFDIAGSLDTDIFGYRLVLLNSEVLRAFAHLVEKVTSEIPSDVVTRMLAHFERTMLLDAEGKNIAGWRHDNPRNPIRAYRWTSALALLALDRVVRMLDATINERVFRHFAVRSSESLQKVRLDDLVYPDYGFVCNPGAPLDAENRKQSIAYFLQRMRAHLVGVTQIPDYHAPCYSLILYGPPGTGKTTLMEALAASSGTHLVEITPSDILVEGEAYVERRARIVFQALSYLSRTTILFDEFDPVLRAREDENPNQVRDVYSFLTPGMLPKLKNLNGSAKKQQSVYCLITNRIGTLDEAAIRSGRFDFKVGVYPPDVVTRIGRCLAVLAQYKIPPDYKKLFEVVVRTKGAGMTALSQEGNFRKGKKDKPPTNTIMSYLEGTGDFNLGPLDADRNRKRHGKGQLHDSDKARWDWIDAWDSELEKGWKSLAAVTDASQYLDKLNEMVLWR